MTLNLINYTERGILMLTSVSISLDKRNSLIHSIAVGGLIVGTLSLFVQDFLVNSVAYGYPFLSLMQYNASGAIGKAAFTGGIATALLGVFFHYVVAYAVTAVFFIAADRIPLLRRFAIVGSMLYGFGTFLVMYAIVLPLSAAPKLSITPTLVQVLEIILAHVLIVGLPLGILVWRENRIDGIN